MKTEGNAIRVLKIRLSRSNTESQSSSQSASMSTEPQLAEMPAWFSTYMTQFKTELKQDITDDIVEKISEILLRNTDLFNRRVSTQGAADKNLVDLIKETRSTSEKVLHIGITCDNCNEPVCGLRFKCGICNDYDLCETCDKIPNVHNPSHVFLRYRQPADNNSGTFVCLPTSSSSSGRRRQRPFPSGFFQRKVSPRRSGSGIKRSQSLASSSAAVRRNTGQNGELVGFDYTRNLMDTSLLLSDCQNLKARLRTNPPVNENLLACRRLLDFQLIDNDSIPDGTFMSPNTQFMKFWHIRNSGIHAWDGNTVLKYSWGNMVVMNDHTEEPVPALIPGQDCTIGIKFQAPAVPGCYQSNWRLHSNGVGFGHRLTCVIMVVASTDGEQLTQVAIDKRVSQENESDEVAVIREPVEAAAADLKPKENDVSNIIEYLTNVHIDQENGQLSERKTPLKSQTTTPNNTPFGLTPPTKSCDKSLCTPQAITEDSDETASILSLSSCDSDSDYVKIPIPHLPGFRLVEPPSPSMRIDLETVKTSTSVSRASSIGSCDFVNVPSPPPPAAMDKPDDTPTTPLLIDIEEPRETVPSPTKVPIEERVQQAPSVPRPVKVSRETGVPEIPTSEPELLDEPLTEQPTQKKSVPPQPSAQFVRNPYEDGDVPTIQVLPEGLVTGALTAAASVYNTARAIFSTMQNPENCPSDGPVVTRPPPPLSPMGQLMEMGFCNREVNHQLLCKHNNDVNAVVAELLSTIDNDWSTTRHQHISVD